MSELIEELPEGFRMTELGPLPEEWEVVRLGEFLDVIRNGIAKKQNKDGKGYPVSRIETISTGVINPNKIGFIEDLTNEEIATYQLKEGDILFSHINSEPYLGNSAIYQNNPPILIHGMNLLVLRTKTAFLDSNFLNYLFNLYRLKGNFIGIASRAVNQSSINQGRLKSLLIPLPPLPEQKKIAAVLSAVQSAKEKTEDVIKATKELKKSLMKYLFTYGPVPVEEAENVPLKETEIGMIPEAWEVVRLGEVVEVFDKKRIPLSEKQRQSMKGKYPYCGANGIIDHINDYIFDGEYVLLAEDGGYWGAYENSAYMMKGQFWVNNHAHILRAIDGEAANYFLVHMLNFLNISIYIAGTTRGKLTQGLMSQIRLPLPPLPIQQKIASILSAVDEKIEAEENKKKALEDLFKTLLHDLMTAKIRVNDLNLGGESG